MSGLVQVTAFFLFQKTNEGKKEKVKEAQGIHMKTDTSRRSRKRPRTSENFKK